METRSFIISYILKEHWVSKFELRSGRVSLIPAPDIYEALILVIYYCVTDHSKSVLYSNNSYLLLLLLLLSHLVLEIDSLAR